MVEKPIEEVNLPSAVAQEAKPIRQQAAVRSITPSQPAPMHEKKTRSESDAFFFSRTEFLVGSSLEIKQ